MAVTAARLGSAPLALDWATLASIPAGTGPYAHRYDPDEEAIDQAFAALKKRFESGEVGFFDAVVNPQISQAEAATRLAADILATGRVTDCLFLGIGGSALGPLSLLSALQERCTSGVRFHFVDNVDPVEWRSVLSKLNPDHTLVCLVTKSGTTFETLAQGMLALEWLGKPRWKTHVVAITDPLKGDLREFAAHEGIPTLHIAPSLGGRFSIFSPVGLFAAALSSLSVEHFLKGARAVHDHTVKTAPGKNPLFILGHELLRHAPKRTVHVCMPYSTRLKHVGAWFVQMWGESLGKQGKGFTPLAGVGATDQHSLLQLLRDGPDDKVTLFLTVDRVPDPVVIPTAPKGAGGSVYPAFQLLEGHSLEELLRVEYQATARVLTNQGRPNVSFHLETLDEAALGALYFSLSLLTAFTGTLWEVDPFDQPGVEEGKGYIRQSLLDGASSRSEPSTGHSAVERLRPNS